MSAPPPDEHIGRVKFFDATKGFGFIEDFDGEGDVYVHASNVASEEIDDRDIVRFRLAPSRRKKGSNEARDVARLSREEVSGLADRYHELKASDRELHMGWVKFFDATKGFGFISEFGNESDVYVDRGGLDGPVEDRDIVVFRRRRSARGRGDKAADVCRISAYEGSRLFLLDYIKIEARSWSGRDVLPNFDKPTLKVLVDRALEAWTPIRRGTLNAVVSLSSALEESGPRAKATAAHLREAVLATASELLRSQLWIEGWDEAFSEDAAAAAIAEASISQKSVLLKRLPRQQFQPVLEKVAAAVSTDTDDYEAFLDAAMEASNLSLLYKPKGRSLTPGERRRVRVDLSTPPARGLYKIAFHAVEELLDAEARLRLFTAGFTDVFDSDTVRGAADRLSTSELDEIFAHKGIDEELRKDLIGSRVDQTTEGAYEDVDNVDVEELVWALKAAEQHLSAEAAAAIREEAVRRLPSATHFDLWEGGVVADYPREYALEHGAAIERDVFARLLGSEGTDAAFAEALFKNRLTHVLEAGGDRFDGVRWLLGLAERHLAPEAAVAFGERAVALLPVEEQHALWKERVVEAYPAAHIMHLQSHVAEALKRSDIERILRYPKTDPGFGKELLEGHMNAAVLNNDGVATPELIDAVRWTLAQAERHLGADAAAAIERGVLDELLDETVLSLWSAGVTQEPPLDHIRARLIEAPQKTLSDMEGWVHKGRMRRPTAASLVEKSIEIQPPVATRAQADLLRAHLRLLFPAGEDGVDTERLRRITETLDEKSSFLVFIHLWLQGNRAFQFDSFKSLVVYLPPSDQIRFIRKLFLLHQRGDFAVTAEKLKKITRVDADVHALAERHHGVHLDLSAEILIQAIVRLQEEGRFLFEGDLLRLAYAGLSGDPSRRLAFSDQGLFDECEGRMEADFNAKALGGRIIQMESGTHYRFEFDYDPRLVAAVKRLPGRRYDPNSQTWTVPVAQEDAVREFAAQYRFGLELEDIGFKTANKHLFTFERTVRPNGVTYCEGRRANKPHRFHGTEFWWCTNRECFENCATAHGPEEWEQYSLLDLVGILGYDCDEARQSGEVVPNGEYYKFVGTVNRFRRLLGHLECRSCGGVLFPVESSHFAHYRVTRFWCEDESCDAHHDEVYLHHCLNGRCNELIDSRDTHQCENGWWICTNDECGSCCSHATNVRRLDNLNRVGAYVPPALAEHVATKAGHLERGMAFCYGCGSPMESRGRETFRCARCGIEYDRGSRRGRRRRPPRPPRSGPFPRPDPFGPDDDLPL